MFVTFPVDFALAKYLGVSLLRAPLGTATQICGREALVLRGQKPLLRKADVLLVAWGFSGPCAGEPGKHHFRESPIWWVRAQGFEP